MVNNWNDWLYYDMTSPTGLRWKVDRISGRYKNQVYVRAHDVAGSLNETGYFLVKLNNRLYCCHRIIYEICSGDILLPSDFIDHKDGVRSNNYPANLRKVTKSVNARNAKKRKDNTSVVGVCKISNGQGSYYWSARCEGLDKTILQKRFSIASLGDTEAFNLACDWRKAMIDELNRQGAGYTNRCTL